MSVLDADPANSEGQGDILVSMPAPTDSSPQVPVASGKHRSPRAGRRSGQRRSVSRGWLALVAALTAVVVALGVFCVLWTADVRGHDAANDRRNAVLAAATVAMSDLVNLSGQNQASAEKQLNALLAVSTGSFRSQFATDVPAEAKLFVQAKAVSVGKIDAVGVNSLTRKTATATVAAEAKITNSQSPQGKTTYYKMTVALAYQKGRWLVSSVGFVP
jgi:Mce-associated membrane protein